MSSELINEARARAGAMDDTGPTYGADLLRRLADALERAEKAAQIHIRVAETIARAFARRIDELEEL